MDLNLPPFDPAREEKPYRRQNCTDQYDAAALGHHALDAGMFDAFDSDDMEGEGKAEYNAGVVAYERGDLNEAAAQLMKALSKAPDAGPARNNLAIVLFQQGEREASLSQFERLLRNDDGEHPNVLRNYSVALWLCGKIKEALTNLERASELAPDDAELYFLRSRLHDQLGEREKVIECMRKAVEVDPENPAAHDNMGLVLQGAGLLDEAIECFRKAHECEPDNPLPMYNLGQALYAADRHEEAIEALGKHLEMRPDHSCAHYEIGKALSELGKHQEALKHFETYHELETGDPLGLCSVGTEKMLLGEFGEGEAWIRRALDVEPAHHWAVHALGLVHKRKEDHAKAVAFFKEAMLRDKENLASQRAAAESLLKISTLEETLTQLRAFPQGGDAGAWLRLMTSLRDEKRPQDALVVGEEALKKFPQDGPIMGTYALAQDDIGLHQEALATLRKTTAINPDDLIAHFHAGRILAETDQYAKARAALEFVVERDPSAVRPREYLLFCYVQLELYDKCEQLSEDILRLDPENVYLRELMEITESDADSGEEGDERPKGGDAGNQTDQQ